MELEATYTTGESTTRSDEETSANGTANGNHVQMASLHGLVKDDEWAALGTALEGLEVETIAGHEVFLVAPFALMIALSRGDGGLRRRRLLVGGEHLFVVHDGNDDGKEKAGSSKRGRQRLKGRPPLMDGGERVGISRGAGNLSPFHIQHQ